jgi:aminopeptidase N
MGVEGKVREIPELAQVEIEFQQVFEAQKLGLLVFEYTGDVATDALGIYQNSYQGGKRRGIGTQCEMCEARKILPCFDEPHFKATFDLVMTVPSFYVVLFNAELLEAKAIKERELTRHVFASTPKMSTYLLAFFVGEAECISAKSKSGVEVRVWTPVGEKDIGRNAVENETKKNERNAFLIIVLFGS